MKAFFATFLLLFVLISRYSNSLETTNSLKDFSTTDDKDILSPILKKSLPNEDDRSLRTTISLNYAEDVTTNAASLVSHFPGLDHIELIPNDIARNDISSILKTGLVPNDIKRDDKDTLPFILKKLMQKEDQKIVEHDISISSFPLFHILVENIPIPVSSSGKRRLQGSVNPSASPSIILSLVPTTSSPSTLPSSTWSPTQPTSTPCSPTSPTCCIGSFSMATSVTSIQNRAYYKCDGLTSVTVASTLTFIGMEYDKSLLLIKFINVFNLSLQ